MKPETIHITKRALAVVGGRDPGVEALSNACDGRFGGDYVHRDDNGFAVFEEGQQAFEISIEDVGRYVDHPACLVLLDAELEGRGVEVAKQRAEIEAGR